MAGLLAYLTFCGLPESTNRNSGGDFKKFLQRLTAAGTAPDFNRIPYYSMLALTNVGTISGGKSKD